MENNITYATEFCDCETDIYKIILKILASEKITRNICNLIINFITNMIIESGDVFLKVISCEIKDKNNDLDRSTFLYILSEIIIPNQNILPKYIFDIKTEDNYLRISEIQDFISSLCWCIETIVKSNYCKISKVDIDNTLSSLSEIIPTLIKMTIYYESFEYCASLIQSCSHLTQAPFKYDILSDKCLFGILNEVFKSLGSNNENVECMQNLPEKQILELFPSLCSIITNSLLNSQKYQDVFCRLEFLDDVIELCNKLTQLCNQKDRNMQICNRQLENKLKSEVFWLIRVLILYLPK